MSRQLRVWETEDGQFIVWGTHGPNTAMNLVYEHLITGGAKGLDECIQTVPLEEFDTAVRLWGARRLVEVEGVWPPSLVSDHWRPFRIPFLIVN